MDIATPKTSEYLTRKQIVDKRLKDAGWTIVLEKDFDAQKPLTAYDRCAIEEYPTASGPADYALCVDGRILGVVEAKKLTLGPQNVLVQSERYSRGVNHSPFEIVREIYIWFGHTEDVIPYTSVVGDSRIIDEKQITA